VEGFLIGLVFAALLVVALLTVSIHGEALELGYRIEEDRRALHDLRRANEAMRTRYSILTTPSSLLPGDDRLPSGEEMSDTFDGLARSASAGARQGATARAGSGREGEVQPSEPAPAPDPLMPEWNVEWVERGDDSRRPRLQFATRKSGQVQNSVDN